MAAKKNEGSKVSEEPGPVVLPLITPEAATIAREEIAQRKFKPSITRPPETYYPNPQYIKILDGGTEGAVVGLSIAAALNYLHAEQGDSQLFSPRMLYEYARLYDEWPGIDYEGSSVIGGMAGLMKAGVCLDRDWPYSKKQPTQEALTKASKNRPHAVLRVELSAEHLRAAIFEFHAVVVSASVHDGWQNPVSGVIKYGDRKKSSNLGGSSFVLLGYTPQGFVIQNSWGKEWAGITIDDRHYGGLAIWTYEDAATNLGDAWVIQLTRQVYRSPLVGYDADSLDGDDLLEIKDEVNAFSYVLASSAIKPPLALGLFGDWGSGKSFFMQEMYKKIASLADLSKKQHKRKKAEAKSPFCSNIVQIRFNAWHYLDSNLWASLVTEIFDKMFEGIGGKSGKPEEQLPRLASELENANGVYQQAKQQLGDARDARRNAEKILEVAVKARELKEGSILTQLDDLKTLLTDNQQIQDKLNQLAKDLGIPELSQSYAALTARANEIKGLGPRSNALLQTMFSTPWGWPRLFTLVAALSAPVLVVAGIELIQHVAKIRLQEFHSFALQFSTFFAAVTAWLGVQARRGVGLLTTLESTQQELEGIRNQRRAGVVASEENELQALKENEDVARRSVQEAALRVQTLQREIQELQPGRLITRFIEERSKSSDYRSRLGIVSLVRRDFERLSELSDPESGKHDSTLMPVQRIILYIDDLDRCRPDRVIEVLEAVHLLLAFRLFMVVVAVDPRWLRRCLEKHYPDLLISGTHDISTVAHVVSSRPATAQDYLEKIFQIPFTLQPLKDDGYRRLIQGLTELNREPEKAKVVSGSEGQANAQQMNASGQSAGEGNKAFDNADQQAKEKIKKQVKAEVRKKTSDEEDAESEVSAIERLQIRSWELKDMESLASLFHTPRSVKRFVNTYRFLRANVRPQYLTHFEGSETIPGVYRAAMTLLAIVISYSNVAPRFLRRIRDVSSTGPGNK
ncbi:MAG: P-loop NTPase fold protein, partial [Gammaproteobacteria bacterium]|nr:P-loop NTPase fold protein [Gammaproteobacteria bacterium]